MADYLNSQGGEFAGQCHTAGTGSKVVAFKSVSGLATELRELRHVHKQFQQVAPDDIVYCQRTVYKRLRALYLLSKRKSWPLVFDFSDPVFLHKPHMTRWFVERADVVLAANRFLQRYAEYYSDTVYHLPMSLPAELYSHSRYVATESDEFVIGWVGNADAHSENLRDFAEVARAIGKAVSNVTVHLVGVRDTPEIKRLYDDINDIDTRFTDWIDSESYEREATEVMASFDTAILPMEDTFWNRGKMPVKLLQYMAVGVPAIGSPVGSVEYVIRDGETGYHASKTDEWIEAVEKLQSVNKRRELSANARRRFEQHYTTSTVAADLTEIMATEFPV